MFEWGWIEDLDQVATAEELARSYELVLAAEAGQFVIAAHWADLHAPEFVEDTRAAMPRLPDVRSTADGCPEIDPSAGAELAVQLRRSPAAGEQLIRQALLVRHRHPLMWEALQHGQVRVWLAAKVAERCAAVRLTEAQAHRVDVSTTPFVESLPPRRFLALVEATIIDVDPAAAEQREKARALARSVSVGRTDEDGMKTLVARAHAGDITYVAAVIDRIATILGDQGDPEPVDARRATALRILANPARALALLMSAAADVADPGLESPRLGEEERGQRGEGTFTDAAGEGLWPGLRGEQQEPGAPEGPAASGHGQALLPPWEELRRLVERLERFDASRLDPVHVVHVHLADAALAVRRGLARVEDLGPATLAAVRDWLVHPWTPEHVRTRIKVRPVLDADAVVPVDRYEIPRTMSELVELRQPFEVFPWSTLSSRRTDKDHRVPYRPDGPRGQTRPDNLGPLGRRTHRLKTFSGWFVTQQAPGVLLWRSPIGFWVRVDSAGSHYLGRAPDLDRRHLVAAA